MEIKKESEKENRDFETFTTIAGTRQYLLDEIETACKMAIVCREEGAEYSYGVAMGRMCTATDLAVMFGISSNEISEIMTKYHVALHERDEQHKAEVCDLKSENKCPNPVQLRLNSERVVRRLIDGDPDLEISIKQAITTSIANSYLNIVKASVNTSEVASMIQAEFTAGIVNWHKPDKYKSSVPVLRDDIKQLIEKRVLDTIGDQIYNIKCEVDEKIKTGIEDIDKRLMTKLGAMEESVVTNITNKRIEETIDFRVNERLEAIKSKL